MRPPDGTGGERLGYGMSTVVISRRQRFDWKAALFFIGFTLLLGALGGLLGGASGFKSFEALQKPPLTPPAAVFPIVWSALYLLMGIAAYLVWSSGDLDRGASLRMYFLQLLVFLNRQLRAALSASCQALFAQPQYAADNAMGTAILTWRSLERGGEVHGA